MLGSRCPNGIEQHYIFDFTWIFGWFQGNFGKNLTLPLGIMNRVILLDSLLSFVCFVHHVDHVLMWDDPEESWVPIGHLDEHVIPLDDSQG